MFRNVTRIKQVLPKEECIAILQNEPRGVLSVNGDDGYPYGMPMNHFYNVDDGKLYFHSGRLGHKVDSIMRNSKASFCVYDKGIHENGNWYLTIRSVIVFGKIEIIEDRDKIYDIARKLSHKFTNDEDYIENEIIHSGPKTLMFALVPEHITGKWVTER
ncbi:MAG: pyridoxamine 5'-phosphate oxidase family protein [Anaerolineaceae bacterium]|nr:pyridoxamine 5'-phosphate oxidase family protein [Anaerolineaceae bacterium]